MANASNLLIAAQDAILILTPSKVLRTVNRDIPQPLQDIQDSLHDVLQGLHECLRLDTCCVLTAGL